MRERLSRFVAHENKGFLVLFVLLLALFALLEFFLGTARGMMGIGQCFPSLGCNLGPYGFDALVHFVSGLASGIFFAMLVRSSQHRKSLGRHVAGLVVFGICVVVAWELTEWIGDVLKVGELYGNLLYAQNPSFQLSRSDTVGDMIFGVVGTLIAGIFGIALRKETARQGKPGQE